jgi:hypothetical protein
MVSFFERALVRSVLRWCEKLRPRWRKPFRHADTGCSLGSTPSGTYRVDLLRSSMPAAAFPDPWRQVATEIRPEPQLVGQILTDTLKGRCCAAALVVGGYKQREDFYLVSVKPPGE